MGALTGPGESLPPLHPPSKLNEILYTNLSGGLVLCLGALTGPGKIFRGGSVSKVYSRTDPLENVREIQFGMILRRHPVSAQLLRQSLLFQFYGKQELLTR